VKSNQGGSPARFKESSSARMLHGPYLLVRAHPATMYKQRLPIAENRLLLTAVNVSGSCFYYCCSALGAMASNRDNGRRFAMRVANGRARPAACAACCISAVRAGGFAPGRAKYVVKHQAIRTTPWKRRAAITTRLVPFSVNCRCDSDTTMGGNWIVQISTLGLLH
jgi:hypothetical protein